MKLNIEEKRVHYSIVAIILLSFFIVVFTEAQYKSVTVDEISHLASGYSYIKTGDFRLNIEATPLVDMISAMPLLFLAPALPLNHSSWSMAKTDEFAGQYHWEFGEQFFYHYGNDPDTLLFYGRLPIMIISTALGLLIFIFSKELFGVRAGLFGLFLYVANPTILANSNLVTIDIGAGFFSLLAVYSFWRFANKITPFNLAMAGFTFGLAQLSKFSAVFLIPVYCILALSIVLKKRKVGIGIMQALTSEAGLTFFGFVAVVFFIGIITIIVGYFIIGFPRYLEGLSYVLFHSKTGHPGYLLGQRSINGWWYYYIVAFLVKEPVALIILILFTIFFHRNIRHRDMLNEYFLIFPIVVLFLLASFTKINIGIRHLLPAYPFLFICIGRIVNIKFSRQKFFILTLALLSMWYVQESIAIYPYHMAYFNEIAHGPLNGPKYLLDSNIDWGQDLKGLEQYLKRNGIKEIWMGYWGKDLPEYRNINYRQINCFPERGISAVSVNNVFGISQERADCLLWLGEYKPIANIGYSIYVYNITDDSDVSAGQEQFCVRSCSRLCGNNSLNYFNSSFFNYSCDCVCE